MDKGVEARIVALQSEINELKAIVATDAEEAPPTSDRRNMIKLVAASAVGAVAGAVMLGADPAAALPVPAAAADGDAVAAGLVNNSTNTTSLTASGDVGVTVFGTPVGLLADGASANAIFTGSGLPPLANTGVVGMLYVDGAGDWWASTTDTAPGLWRKLAGPNTAGQLHVLPSPVRVYDSRTGQAPVGVGPKVPTAVNAARTIDTTANGSGVPTAANAVLVNLTITGPQTAGFASAWPTGVFPGTSSINFAALQSIAATTVVGCGPSATIQVLANAITDFLIDVIGYYQ
jgi:hypothetical protein